MNRNQLVFVPLLLFFLVAAGILSYSYFLPWYIEKRVFPNLGSYLSSSITGKVYSTGLFNVVLGNIVVGDPQNISGRIGSIHVIYNPLSLLVRKLDSIKVDGLSLNVILSDEEILVPGIDLEKFTRTKTEQEEQPGTSAINLPIGLESFQITNSHLNIHYRNQLIVVPFIFEISKKEKGDLEDLPVYKMNMQIIPPGSETTITGTLDLADNTCDIVFGSDFLDLNHFGLLLGEMLKKMHFGPANYSGKAKFQLVPFQFASVEIDGELASVNLGDIPVTFGIEGEKSEKKMPLHLKLKNQGKQWAIVIQGAVTEPFSGILELNTSFGKDDESFNGSGNIFFRLSDPATSRENERQYLMIKGNPEFTGNFFFDRTTSGIWQAKLESVLLEKRDTKPELFLLQYGSNILETNTPAVSVYGKGSAGHHEVNASLDMSDLHAMLNDSTELNIPKASFRASFIQDSKSNQENRTRGSFSFLLPGIKYSRNGLTGRADITLEGTLPPQEVLDMQTLQATGKVSVRNGILEEESSSLKIGSLDGQIPWHWPMPGQETSGKIKATQISWNKTELGSFDADIKFRDAIYNFDGRYASSLVKGIVTDITGKAAIADSGFQANLSFKTSPTPFSSLHLGRIDPALNNTYLVGVLGLDGALIIDAEGLRGDMSINLQNGRLENSEKKYEVDNIAFALQLPFLPDLRSNPAQAILFDKASFGDLVFEKGKIIWQLESKNTIFIEEGVVRWSGGRVFTNAVRFSPDRTEFVVTIFCDRLILAEILRQFGITNAEGEGTVSGRLPLLVGINTIGFEDGFLYSSPGQGGSVKVAAFDLLSAGIPKNTPQFAQVDFAAEALRNFKYNWVKLILNSEGEDLVMQMQMDGKPLQSLPFNYDSQTGLLQRIEDSSKGIDQPIRLDVNFRFPLNRFLGYSDKLKGIMEKIK